jgi:hypothetical protein
VDAPREKMQADMLRDLMVLFYSHPAVVGVSLSSIWEAAAANRKASLYRRNMAAKPSARMLEELLASEWWHESNGTTDAAGRVQVQAFHGTYTVTVGADPGEEREVVLTPDGATVTVELD